RAGRDGNQRGLPIERARDGTMRAHPSARRTARRTPPHTHTRQGGRGGVRTGGAPRRPGTLVPALPAGGRDSPTATGVVGRVGGGTAPPARSARLPSAGFGPQPEYDLHRVGRVAEGALQFSHDPPHASFRGNIHFTVLMFPSSPAVSGG